MLLVFSQSDISMNMAIGNISDIPDKYWHPSFVAFKMM